jgi:hypothetical protein
MTTIISPTPFVGRRIEDIRARHDWSAQLGVPAHVTLLGPFLDPAEVDGQIVGRLREIVSGQRRFHATFDRLALLGDVACLLPADPSPFEHLHRTLHEHWPHLPRRSGHQVTVARDLNDAEFELLANSIEPLLPLVGSVREVMLLATDGNGGVQTMQTFDLV